MSKLPSVENLSDNDISKIIGLTVNVKLNNQDNYITGVIFTVLKAQKMLICKIILLILKVLNKDENKNITSHIINIPYLEEIKISTDKIQVN
jgi:hypothetical protein